MKQTFTAIILILLLLNSMNLGAQTTTLETDFSDPGGTGFTEDFKGAEIDTLWDLQNNRYDLEQSGGELMINTSKNSGFQSFYRKLPAIYDFSDHPWVNLTVKGEEPFICRVYLVDIDGKNEWKQVRILQSENFVTASFDFSGINTINLEQITEVLFAFNPRAQSFGGTVWFEELKIGSDAFRLANIGGQDDKEYYINSGTKTILLTDIENASSLELTGGSTLIENASFTEISGGMSELSFDIIEDSTGSATLTVTATGEGSYVNNFIEFDIVVSANYPPVFDPVNDLIAVRNEPVNVVMSGISDGDVPIEQELTISVISEKETVIPNPVEVSCKQGSPYAYFSFTPIDTGLVTLDIILADDGGGEDTVTGSFSVMVYQELNHPPTIDPVDKQAVFNDAGEQTLILTGLTDGDEGTQQLSIYATSSADTIVPDPLLEYSGGESATLKYTPVASHTGSSLITVTLVDNGGSAINNGNDSTLIQFEIETRTPPKKGYVVPIEGDPYSILAVEGKQFALTLVDSGDFKAIKIDMTEKFDWGGMWMSLPTELDLTDKPVISYEVYSVDNITYHWNYFYDVEGNRNIQNSTQHMLPVTAADQWETITFDYRDEGDLNTNEGELIQVDRVENVLFNLHHQPGGWPNTFYTGTVYYRNIRLGDSVTIAPKTPVVTVNGVPEQVHFVGEGEKSITLSGISDGSGGTDNISITAVSNLPGILPDPVVKQVQEDGTAELTYIVGDESGIPVITVEVSAPGSEPKSIKFDINILEDDPMESATITIDRGARKQTILGMGTFSSEKRWVDTYARDLGASAVRMGLISNQIEPVNDNDDPYVLNREGLNYNAFDWEYVRMLKEAGVETFILTSWSPPSWMKRTFSKDYYMANAEGSTEQAYNRLDFHQYDEYAESMVAVVKMFEEEAGVHLEAIGLQNEPSFDEPYASAILDPTYFTKLIEVVGKRFEQEGITTRLYMPEQVFGQTLSSISQYIDTLIAHPEADKYCDIIATHGYAGDGINQSFPKYSEWTAFYNQAQQGVAPKELWMSETFIEGGSFASALETAGAIHGSLWAGNISLWTNWAFENMQMKKNEPTHTFYTSKNFFRYIRPGAVRVITSSDHPKILATAFEHDDQNTMTIVLLNTSSVATQVKLYGNNLPERYGVFRTTIYEHCIEADSVTRDIFIVPPKSVTTLVATGYPQLLINAVGDQHLEMNDPEQVIALTGIDDGAGGIDDLSLSVSSDNPSLISGLTVSTVETGGTAMLNYTPATDQTGAAKITVLLTDGSDVTEMSFYVFVLDHTGIMKKKQDDLKVWPNPADDRLYIEIPDMTYNELVVYDLSGRVMLRRTLQEDKIISIETSNFESGLYIIMSGNKTEQVRARFIVE